ncbi:MAG: hypothetical protein IJX31_05340 [Clostridia bacterium]|nr:hypothetical protein [Clostridia bacterium]
MEKIYIKNWTIEYANAKIPSSVPGDITVDLYNAGIVQNPYFGMNHKESEWIDREDFSYFTEIVADEELLKQESVELVFDGIDTFADIYLNGTLLGKTKNMFLQYRFEIGALLQKGANILRVDMKSTRKVMETYDMEDYYAIFNPKRLFVRKAQCHFGWDWAPDLCGYGIWGDVYMEVGDKCRIDSVYVIADHKGQVTFLTELNYNIKERRDVDGNVIEGSFIPQKNDTLHYSVSAEPFGELTVEKSIPVTGKKNLACFIVENAKLWWPLGYGDPNLYNYKIELERDGKIIYEKNGRFGFRTVELAEEPKGDSLLGYALKVNGEEIFVKGANWVPAECFTGVITEEKYRTLTQFAKDGNFNMLRVWGGGVYEKDAFYDFCDEQGIMVWQDMMFACADIPEDKPDFVNNATEEITYQIKRLRNHPALVYWCGGNEKTGSYGLCITKGDFFTDCIIRGVILSLDKTRPFASQSPCGWTDVGNDCNSGESHHNSFERALEDGMDNYRRRIAEKIVPFISEAALMGPNSVETTKKIYPQEKLWPMNEIWDDRLMCNPYGSSPLTFCQRQMKYSTDLYGKVKNLEDFTAKAMLVHAEAMRAELEFARSNKGKTSGFMNWMFNDIWPSGSWSVIDYWGEPKQVYYQMRKSYAPHLLTYVLNGEGVTQLVVVNDSLLPFNAKIRYGKKKISGETLDENTAEITGLVNGVWKLDGNFDGLAKDEYLFVEYEEDGETKKNLYSPTFWSGINFESDYETKIEYIIERSVKVTVKAKAFAKSVFISLPDNYKYTYSDNYIDVEAGEEKSIIICADEPIDVAHITVTDFAKMTK